MFVQQGEKIVGASTAAPPRKRNHAAAPLDTSWMPVGQNPAMQSQQGPSMTAEAGKAADKVSAMKCRAGTVLLC